MAASMSQAWRRYLLLFAHEHLEFRLPEVLSIARMQDLKYCIPDGGFHEHSPYLFIDVKSEECIRRIMSRTMLVKAAFELWGKGSNYKELEKDMKKYPCNLKEPYLGENQSFCIRLETFNKALAMEEKIKRIELVLEMDSFPVKGKVNLKRPDVSFQLLEYYGQQTTDPSTKPEYICFGRWVADGQREIIKNYTLEKRKYIGNTSMDAGLSFIMTNMGCVRPNDVIFDPFVGTGSLLVSAAHFGGYVVGTDIDYKLLMGRGKASKAGQKWRSQATDNIRASLRQYGLEGRYLDALVADCSLHNLWRPHVTFDAIITDPPYGVRESTERLGTKKTDVAEIPEHLKEAHIPSRVQYHISDVMRDLLKFAARHLRLHGRLVYWLPVYRPEYSESQIPRHPCLRLVANSEQGLTRRIGRRLITMEKIAEPQPEHEGVSHEEDHYKEATFRDMYFRPTDWEKRKERAQTGEQSEAQCASVTQCTNDVHDLTLNNQQKLSESNSTTEMETTLHQNTEQR